MADSDGIQFGSFELAKSKGGQKLTLLGSESVTLARHWSIGLRPEFFFAPKLKNKSTTAARTRVLTVLTVLTFLTLDLPSISGPELVSAPLLSPHAPRLLISHKGMVRTLAQLWVNCRPGAQGQTFGMVGNSPTRRSTRFFGCNKNPRWILLTAARWHGLAIVCLGQ